jgi:simple sugar transport system permease protein
MNDSVLVLTLAGAVATSTPVVLAALGELLAERSGVLNLGVEGMMLVGAVAGIGIVNTWAASWPVGLVAAAVAGMMLASVHAFACITLGLNQIVSGLALVVLGAGISSFVADIGSSPLDGQPAAVRIPSLTVPWLENIPVVGPIAFDQDPVVYATWGLTLLIAFYLRSSRFGLRLRAVGDSPATADAVGVSVANYRWVHVLAGGALAGIGGAYVSLSLTPAWTDGLTVGQGWIAIAIVIFAGWRAIPVLVGAYLFGVLGRLGFALQAAQIEAVPPELLAMIPFVVAMVLLVVLSGPRMRRRRGAPLALAVPFERGSSYQE